MKLVFMKWTRLQLLIAFCALFDAWVLANCFDAGDLAKRWGFKDTRHFRAILKALTAFRGLHSFVGVDDKSRRHVFYCATREETIKLYTRVGK